MNMVKQYMIKIWNFVQLPDMYYHEEGYFLLKFRTHKDMEAVMMKEPYTNRNMHMLLTE